VKGFTQQYLQLRIDGPQLGGGQALDRRHDSGRGAHQEGFPGPAHQP
jgi:hypothetical protein